MENLLGEELTDLYLIVNDGTRFGWQKIDRLSPGEARPAPMSNLTDVQSAPALKQAVGAAMKSSLVRQGLFPSEADVMLKTWEDSWFAEKGVRVLYPFTRKFTDSVLPIHLDPEPKNLVRVMIGRAEIITPAAEAKMESAVTKYTATQDPAARRATAADLHDFGFGRFSEAILRRVMSTGSRSREFSSAAWDLIQESAKLDHSAAGGL